MFQPESQLSNQLEEIKKPRSTLIGIGTTLRILKINQ